MDKKISQLDELDVSENEDLLVIVDIDEPSIGKRTKKQTKENFLKEINSKLPFYDGEFGAFIYP